MEALSAIHDAARSSRQANGGAPVPRYYAVMDAEVDLVTRLIFQCFDRKKVISSMTFEFSTGQMTVIFRDSAGATVETWSYKSDGQVEAASDLAVPVNPATWREAMRDLATFKTKVRQRILASLGNVLSDDTRLAWRGTLSGTFTSQEDPSAEPSQIACFVDVREDDWSLTMTWRPVEAGT